MMLYGWSEDSGITNDYCSLLHNSLFLLSPNPLSALTSLLFSNINSIYDVKCKDSQFVLPDIYNLEKCNKQPNHHFNISKGSVYKNIKVRIYV